MIKPIIFDIQRFCVHDGPGIRTTVFLKGCNLRCRWCHNPEGLVEYNQILYDESKCISCGDCVEVCKNGAQSLQNNIHTFNRDYCKQCFECAEKCAFEALKTCGKQYETQQLVEIVLKDKDFYGNDGGVTFSGGEALRYAEYIAEAMQLCRQNGITTAVDTCGFVPWSAFEATLPFVETYLYDIKLADCSLHKQWTGFENTLILSNLHKLDSNGANIYIRVPIIGGVNDNINQITKIGEIICNLKNVKRITLIPYNSLGKKKCQLLGYEYKMTDTAKVNKEKLFELRNALVDMGLNVDNTN